MLYAIPSLAFFVVLIDYTGQTELTVMIPLTVYSLVVLVPAIVDGVRSVPQETLAAATAMGFGPVRRYVQVQLPIAVPAIIAGLRVATVSSISLVSVGMLIGNQGALGNLLHDAQIYNRPELAWNSVITSAALAVLADAALVVVRILLTPWMPSATRGAKSRPAGVRPEPACPPWRTQPGERHQLHPRLLRRQRALAAGTTESPPGCGSTSSTPWRRSPSPPRSGCRSA